MRQLTDSELEKLKQIELEILREIDRVCRKNNIRYSLAYGTLIGAVRHKGFIPWDDDIDLMMLREDYDRFLSVAERELSDRFYLTDIHKDKSYGIPFAKVMAKGTKMLETSAGAKNTPSGVWVDIFPLDVSPKGDALKAAQYERAQSLKSIMCCKANYRFNKKGLSLLIYRVRKLLYIAKSHFVYADDFDRNAKQYMNTPQADDKVVSLCGNIGVKKATFDRRWFNSYTDLPFEDNAFMAISDYDSFLKQTYGDYKKLPPKEEQIAHHFVDEVVLS